MSDMEEARLSDLDGLVTLTEHMLSKARAAEWDDIPALEGQRLACLKSVLGSPVAMDYRDAVAQRLRRILILDQELLELALAAKDESANELTRLRRGQHAGAAYASHTVK
jgi:hypothetical protein